MTSRLRRHASTLKLLHDAKPALRKAIIENSNTDLIKCLCDCALNVLQGNAPISKAYKSKLSKHKTALRRLVDRKVSLQKKRKTIQKGGFLGALLGAVIPAIGTLIGSLASRK